MSRIVTKTGSLDSIEFAREFLREVPLLVKSGDLPTRRGEFTLWTDAIKHWLAQKAKSLTLRPIYCDRDGSSEFMLDLIWWQDGPGGSAVLACESELGNTRDPRRNPARIAEDFDKLLSFKAKLKLIIFDSYSKSSDTTDKQDAVLYLLNQYLREYGDHRLGEVYLAIDVAEKQGLWSWRRPCRRRKHVSAPLETRYQMNTYPMLRGHRAFGSG